VHSGEPVHTGQAGRHPWGFTSHRMTLLTCQRCRCVRHFDDKRSTFDPD
jgi:hypothetical protein